MQVNKAKATAFIDSKWVGDKACPICRQVAWSLSDIVVEMPEFNQGSVMIGGPRVPLVPVTCTNCGFTHLFNAILIGVLEQPAQVVNLSSGPLPAATTP